MSKGGIQMNELTVIQQQEILGKPFTVYGDFENPLFLAREVAEWIEHSNVSMMLQSIDDDEKELHQISTLNNAYSAWFLTEDGVYEVLMQSRKPIAKHFKKEVKAVLKSIRKHGAYMTPETLEQVLLNPDTMIKLCTTLKEEQQKRQKLETEIAMKNQMIAELNPKASYYDVILQTKDMVAITTIAKDYGKSAKWLNNYLNEKGIQFKQGKVWLLYQKYAENGYTASKTHTFEDNNGIVHSKILTHWTQKGRLFIYDLLKKEGILPLIEREIQRAS